MPINVDLAFEFSKEMVAGAGNRRYLHLDFAMLKSFIPL